MQEAPTAPGVTRSSVVSAAPATPTPVPVLRMVPLISKELRTGEMLRLRGSLQDLATGRALPDGIRYSSADPRIARVDSRTGEVTGVSAGRVRIVADGGAAGKQGVDLSIIAIPKPVIAPTVAAATPRTTPTPTAASPTVARAVVATPPSAKPVAAAPTSTPTSVTPTPAKPLVVASSTPVIRPNAAQPATLRVDSAAARSVARPPVARAPIASVASTGSTIAPQLLRDVERPDASDTRAAAERIASDIRTGGRRNGELTQFFVDGASHRVGIAGAPTIVGETANGVRVTFELRISKYDAGGRPMTRLVPVQMDVAKREEGLSTTAIAIGALRRP